MKNKLINKMSKMATKVLGVAFILNMVIGVGLVKANGNSVASLFEFRSGCAVKFNNVRFNVSDGLFDYSTFRSLRNLSLSDSISSTSTGFEENITVDSTDGVHIHLVNKNYSDPMNGRGVIKMKGVIIFRNLTLNVDPATMNKIREITNFSRENDFTINSNEFDEAHISGMLMY